jgi:hypothetical protein
MKLWNRRADRLMRVRTPLLLLLFDLGNKAVVSFACWVLNGSWSSSRGVAVRVIELSRRSGMDGT